MKTELINREHNASLIISAESEFEKKVIELLERFKDKEIVIFSNQEWGRTTHAQVTITFNYPDATS